MSNLLQIVFIYILLLCQSFHIFLYLFHIFFIVSISGSISVVVDFLFVACFLSSIISVYVSWIESCSEHKVLLVEKQLDFC